MLVSAGENDGIRFFVPTYNALIFLCTLTLQKFLLQGLVQSNLLLHKLLQRQCLWSKAVNEKSTRAVSKIVLSRVNLFLLPVPCFFLDTLPISPHPSGSNVQASCIRGMPCTAM